MEEINKKKQPSKNMKQTKNVSLNKKSKINRRFHKEFAEISEDTFSDIIELMAAPPGQLLYSYNLKTEIISWKGDVKRILGYSNKECSECVGKKTKLIHPEDVKKTQKLLKDAEKNCSPYDLQYRFQAKKNSYITVSDRGFFIPNKKGKAFQAFGVLNDISEIIINENKLRERKKEFLSIVNEMPHYIYRINLKGELTFANIEYRNLFGLTLPEILGKTVYDLHPKKLADKYAAENKKVFRTNKTFYTIEENVNKITGKKEIFEVLKIPLPGKLKNVIGLQGIYWNITDRVATLNTLKNAESNYREIFNATGEAIFIHNADSGKILDVNETAVKMYGYSKEELCALTINELSAGDSFYNNAAAVKKIVKAPLKGSLNFEWLAKRKNGKLFWVEVALRKSKIGDKGRVLAVVRDISKRKEDEKALLLSQISINNSKDAVIWFDKFGGIIYVNKAASEMLGYSKKEIYYLTITDIEKNDKTGYWNIRLDQLNKKGSLLAETFFINKNGNILPVEISVSRYKYKNEEFIFIAARNTAERKQAEEKLKESEKRFRDLAELLPQGIFECDIYCKIKYGNKKILEMFQYANEDIEKGFYIIDSVVPEDKTKAMENIKLLLQGKINIFNEYNMVRKDGSIFPASIYSSVITEEGGPKGLRGIIVDLSEKKIVEKEKQERDSLFSLLFEKAGDANLLMEGDRFIDCNETTVIALNAKSKKDIIGKHPWDISPEFQPDGEKSSEKSGKLLEIAYREGSCRFEWAHMKLDGSIFYVEVILTAIPIKGEWRLHTAWRDITDNKIAAQKEKIFYQRLEKLLEIERKILSAQSNEEIAHAALRHLRNILDCGRASIILFDFINDEFKVIAIDSSIAHEIPVGSTYKISESGVINIKEREAKVIKDFSQINFLPKLDKILFGKGTLSILSVPIIIGDKIAGSLNLSSDEQNNFNEDKIKIAQDVSVSISLALQHSDFIEQINNHNLELEKKIDERTLQLRQTISELESFSYSVSHDLRSPLRAIGGFSQAIIDDYSGKLDEQGVNLLNRIISASQRMSDLIDAMLNLARITRAELVFDDINISSMAVSVIDGFQKRDKERANVKFIIKHGMFVKADNKLIRIVIENLLSNAWKFTEKKDKTIIEFGRTTINGLNTFFVRDNGAGFDMNYSNKLFGPFQRLHNRDEFEGTGIGLATAKRIILRHNGAIWAESKLGEGATFYFTIGDEFN